MERSGVEESPQDNDPQLVARLIEGNEDAYARVIQLYQGPLYRFCLFQMRNSEAAEDLVCDTFAALVKALPRLDAPALNLRAYLYGIARNLLREHGRHSREYAQSELLELVVDLRADILAAASSREHLRLALQAVGELEEPARQVMLLRYVEDYSLREIAALTALPLNTVKSLIHRAIERVRNSIGVEVKP